MDQVVAAPAAPAAPSLAYASVGRRYAAALVDSVILGIVSVIISILAGVFQEQARVVSSLINLVVSFSYYIFFIGNQGQTLGKKLLKIKVVRLNGERVGYGRAALREIIGKTISGLVLMLGYLWAAWDSKKQTWHDKMARTVVVKV